jgi:hypothetical protein
MIQEMDMSEEEQQPEKISEAQKLMFAVFGAIVIGFVMVGASKEKQSPEQMEAASMIRNYVAMQEMATPKCVKAILDNTGEQVYFPSETLSDKETFITLKYVGEEKGGFKTAACTLHNSLGGISELVIDGKEIIKKKL